MTTPVIMDAIVVIVLAVAAYCGAKRGLLQSLAGLIIVVMALVGAAMVAGTLAEPAAKLTAPLIGERIGERVEEAIEEQASEWSPGKESEEDPETFQIQNLLGLLGLDEEMRDSLTERTQNTIRETGVSIATAVAESLIRSFAYGVLFLLSFVALLLLLKVLAGAMGLVLKLPGLRGLNALGGVVIGLMEGALLLFLAVWIARKLGVSFETPALAEAHILRIFTTNTSLGLLSFLQ